MIPVLFRFLCATPKGEAQPAPIFVFMEGRMPAAPFPGLEVKVDYTGRRFVVEEVQWDRERSDAFIAYLRSHGDASPLQTKLTLEEMLATGWKLP